MSILIFYAFQSKRMIINRTIDRLSWFYSFAAVTVRFKLRRSIQSSHCSYYIYSRFCYPFRTNSPIGLAIILPLHLSLCFLDYTLLSVDSGFGEKFSLTVNFFPFCYYVRLYNFNQYPKTHSCRVLLFVCVYLTGLAGETPPWFEFAAG